MRAEPTNRLRLKDQAILALRASLVLIFLLFGAQKFAAPEAQGITEYTLHSPLSLWLTPIRYRDVARILGVAELTWGALLAYGFFRPGSVAALLGGAGSTVTYLVTLSVLLTPPGIFVPNQAPIFGVEGLFLVKNAVLLAASLVMVAQGPSLRRGRG